MWNIAFVLANFKIPTANYIKLKTMSFASLVMLCIVYFVKSITKTILENRDWFYLWHILNLSLMKKKTNDPVAMHFYTNEHTVDDNCVIGIEKV